MTETITLSRDLKRYPVRKKELLQAWDSADELILEHLNSIGLEALQSKKILIINDSFGALSHALQRFKITCYTDSYVSWSAAQMNTQNQVTPIHELSRIEGLYDLVLIRIPKIMSFFEDILSHLSRHLHPQSQVICGAMVKHLSSSSFTLLNQIIGSTTASLARKKARLIFARLERIPTPSPYPSDVKIPNFEHSFLNHSNLFSREKLDIGTRFLLDHIPTGNFKTILDLGCGNGILGIAAKQAHPKAKIIFSDESQMAILSAQANYNRFFSDLSEDKEFIWTDCFKSSKKEQIDLVLCNPPFHQGHTLGNFIAVQMFTDSYEALRPGGVLRVIGNSHLNYPRSLREIFKNCQLVATHQKFVILDAIKK